MAALDQHLVLGDLYPPADGGMAVELTEELLRDLPAVAAEAPTAARSAESPPDLAPTTDTGVAEGRDRRLTEADYSAWADRMKARRREEIEFSADEADDD